MSTQINQYLMYGIALPYTFAEEWEKAQPKEDNKHPDFYTHFEGFIQDSAFNDKIVHKEGIFCLFDGRDGRCIIIGRVIARTSDHGFLADEGPPLTMKAPTPLEQELLAASIERNFGVTGEMQFHFVTMLR